MNEKKPAAALIVTPTGEQATSPNPDNARTLQGVELNPLAYCTGRVVLKLSEFLTAQPVGKPVVLEGGTLLVAIPLPYSLQIVQALQLENLRRQAAADAAKGPTT